MVATEPVAPGLDALGDATLVVALELAREEFLGERLDEELRKRRVDDEREAKVDGVTG
mgnify:CR=1 FL=1